MIRTPGAAVGLWLATGLLLAAGCSDEDVPDATTTTSTTIPPPTPPFSDIEERIADTLAGFGLVVHRAENPRPGSASLWVALEDGGELYVSALLAGTNNGNPTVIDETTVDGIVVRTVEYESGLSRLAFDCRTHEYEVTGDPPSDHDDLTSFTAALANALSCRWS